MLGLMTGRRLVAYLIDQVITTTLMLPILIWYTRGLFSEASGIYLLAYSAPVLIIWLLIRTLYLSILFSTTCATLGCFIMGIRIRSVEGKRLGYGRSLLRCIGLLICTGTLGLAYLTAFFTERHQGLQDVISRSVVVEKNSINSSVADR
jgi:uncharacterized RDD family membrane protein YckC